MITETSRLLIALIITIIICILILIFTSDTKSEPNVIYQSIPEIILDTQFSKTNVPSIIYQDMFTQNSPWIGGYQLGNGKTYVMKKEEKKISL